MPGLAPEVDVTAGRNELGSRVTVIALWLDHESPETTRQYIEADLKLKEELLDKAKGLTSEP